VWGVRASAAMPGRQATLDGSAAAQRSATGAEIVSSRALRLQHLHRFELQMHNQMQVHRQQQQPKLRYSRLPNLLLLLLLVSSRHHLLC
jgi:hypothetical protein